MKIPLQELTDLSKRALRKYGYPGGEAAIILDMLMYAQTRGNDQGIVKLIGKGIPRHPKAQTPTIEKETSTTAIINANLSMEAVAMEQAVDMVIRKAVLLFFLWIQSESGKACGRCRGRGKPTEIAGSRAASCRTRWSANGGEGFTAASWKTPSRLRAKA